MTPLELRELLRYALGDEVPDGFLGEFIRRRDRWDDEFIRRLDELAYEFRPDLAVWVIEISPSGRMRERRLPFLRAG